MNITDVEDKIIRSAMQENKSLREYTAVYEKAFLEDAALLRLQTPEKLVRATEHIAEMIHAIEELSAKGFTYNSDGSVYYRIAQFPSYGKLSKLDFDGMRAGARVDVDEYDKDDARDFVLWKAKKDSEPAWESPMGEGRPGWHIECSVMAMKYLGETLDIHAGGIDLTFPHHENEIAQSEALTGKQFARCWLHSEHLIVEGQKMSKSLGNFYTLRDLIQREYSPESIRYLLASVPYRKKLNFTFDGLRAAATAIERLRNYKLRLDTAKFAPGTNEGIDRRTAAALEQFDSSLDDDLNTAEALAAIFEYVRDTNSAMDAGDFLEGNAPQASALFERFDSIFDVLNPTVAATAISDEDVERLVAERQAARKAKNFKRSDEIRNELTQRGIVLEDTKDGVRWKRK
jgi:cysteinyl-tRNA synthetase